QADGKRFTRGASPDELVAGDERWRVSEENLIGPDGRTLPRLPAHVAYWFAWAGYFENATLGGPSPDRLLAAISLSIRAGASARARDRCDPGRRTARPGRRR